MPTIRIAALEDSFLIHFGGEFSRINAYTLATAISNIADAAKAANAELNPGYEIEILVETLGAGSFRATLRAVYKSAGNLFTQEGLRAIVLSVIASFVYEHTLAPSADVKVVVQTEEVVIEQGDTRVVIPREIHQAAQQLETNRRFRTGIGQALRAVEEDPRIESLGFGDGGPNQPPPLDIPKSLLSPLTTELADGDSDTREIVELTDVEILKAILEPSRRRRWQFVWNGMKISAPVTDSQFYEDFTAHRIMIAPGDALRVRLRIRQRRSTVGVFINVAYEVVEVVRHIPRPPAASGRLLPSH